MRVAIIGSGYVGLVTAVGLAEIGHDVRCVDKDIGKVDLINEGKAPIFEPGLDDLLAKHSGTRLTAMESIDEAVHSSDVSLITVDTPFDGERIGLDSVAEVSSSIGEAIAELDFYHVVVVKSTVVPGTTESFVLPALEAASGKHAGEDFGVGTNPEFLREGQAIEDFLDPDRLVLGGIDDRTHDVLEELYTPFAGTEMMRTSPSTAEMIKYTSNSLLATLISFSNEIANLATEVGVDAREVMHGVHLDRRLTPILSDGSRIWPGIISYLEPGCGFGGSCFPKDVRSLVAFGAGHEVPMRILESVMDVNDRQPTRMLDLLRRHIPDPEGKRVTVLGLSFKPGTDDVRESPALGVVPRLSEMGAIVTVYDPVAHAEAAKVLEEGVIYAGGVADAVAGADAVLLMTSWEEFTEVSQLVRAMSPQPVVVDGRGLLDPEGLDRYEDIGR